MAAAPASPDDTGRAGRALTLTCDGVAAGGVAEPAGRADGPTVTGAAVRVDTSSPVPPYEQIRAQLASLITTGQLREGERLPTVRQLAADLGLAAGTVARAYRELEAASLIVTRRGAGTRALGFGGEEVPAAVREALRE